MKRSALRSKDPLKAVKTEKEHIGDVRFAHEKMRERENRD